MADIPGLDGSGALLMIADHHVSVRLTRGVFRLEERHIDLARAVSSVAREHVEARVEAAVAAGGRTVDDADAPAGWILADRAGNRVCIAAWPDGSVPRTPADQQ